MVASLGVSACGGPKELVIQGNMTGLPDSAKIQLYNIDTEQDLDSTWAIGGCFQLRGILTEEPQSIWLSVSAPSASKTFVLWLGNERVKIEGDFADFPYRMAVSGSKYQDQKQVFDALTAQFISDRTGEASISVTSKAKQLGTWCISNYTPEYRETSGVGRRKLMTMDEVLRMDTDKALVIIRGKNVLEVDKYDYSKHPEAKKLRPSKAAAHIPAWREEPPETACTSPTPAQKPARKKKAASKASKVAEPAEARGHTPAAQAIPAAEADPPGGKPALKPKIIAATKESILSKPNVKKEE